MVRLIDINDNFIKSHRFALANRRSINKTLKRRLPTYLCETYENIIWEMDQIGSPEHISSSWLESISYAGGVTKTCVFMQRPIGDYLVEDDDKWSWDLDVVIRWMSISMKSRVICIFGENHNWLMQVSINNLQHKKWILIKNPWVTWMFLFSLSVNWLTVVNIKVSALNSITNWPPSPPVAPTRQLKLQIRSRYFQCTLDAILCIPSVFPSDSPPLLSAASTPQSIAQTDCVELA